MAHTLLLADDSVTIQRVIELTFADEDIRVIAVGDGQQAIDRIKADPPDIVLADTGMPERDGYDVSTFIKEDPALEHIPVVLLTGAFEPVDGDRVRQAGCDAVLVKPFEPQAVVNRVRELLGERTVGVQRHARPATEVPTVRAELARDTGDYLDKIDEAFELLEPVQGDAPAPRPAALDLPGPPERSDSAPETAPAAVAPAGAPPATDSPPTVEPVPALHAAPVPAPVSPPKPPSDVVIAPISVTATPPPVAIPTPTPPVPVAVSGPVPLRPAGPPAPPLAQTAPPSLAEAFASLLAAEQGGVDRVRTLYPWPTPAAPAGVSEELVEQVTERVIARLTTGVTNDLVTEVVARVAERLVREQIDRITEV